MSKNLNKAIQGSLDRLAGHGLPLLLLVLGSLLTGTTLSAQPKDNAPYSRIGLGEPLVPTLSAAGFAGLSAGYSDPLHLNLLNPASYAWLGATTFEMGMYAERATLKTNAQSANVTSGNLSHLALAFPMRNPLNDILENKQRKLHWAMNIALLPNTSIGYDIQTDETNAISDSIRNVFQGTGGTNRLVWGNGIRYQNFSAGVNIGYIFGQLESLREATIQDLENDYFAQFVDNISIRGLQWTFGAQYKFDLDKNTATDERYKRNRSIVIGLYGNPTTSFNTNSTVLRITESTVFGLGSRDTIFSGEDIKQNGKLPAEWTLGFMYQELSKWRIGAEFSYANWEKYENEAKPENLHKSSRFAIGAEYSPDALSYNNYLKRIRYRAGFYYKNDPRLEDLKNYALTLGLGLPVILPRGQTSFVNIAVEAGRFQTDNKINENFVKMSLGFTLNDGSWFYKRKFR